MKRATPATRRHYARMRRERVRAERAARDVRFEEMARIHAECLAWQKRQANVKIDIGKPATALLSPRGEELIAGGHVTLLATRNAWAPWGDSYEPVGSDG